MNIVMPPLLQSAQLEPEVNITSADSEYMDDSNENRVEIATLGAKRIGIRTSVLEEKATACSMLCCYADELKENFYPWIDLVAPTLVPLLKFYFHEEVRRAAVLAMLELLRSAKLAVEKGLAQVRDESYVKQLFDYIVPALVEALHKESEIEICSSMLDSLNQCMQGMLISMRYADKHALSGHLLDEGQIRYIVDEIKYLITLSTIRKREIAKLMEAEDCKVSDCLGTMIKTYKAFFVPFLDELSVYIIPMWVLCAGKTLATEQTVRRMIKLLKQLHQTMPPAFLASLLSSLPPHRQIALQSAMSS